MTTLNFWNSYGATFEEKWKNSPPCPFCGAYMPRMESGWATISSRRQLFFWVACNMCGSQAAKAETQYLALDNWCERTKREYIPLGPHSYILPMQKYGHLLVWEDQRNVSFIDYIEGEVHSEVNIDLGHFRICRKEEYE